MPIQIYRPTPKEDPMDKLSKALSVAGSVLAIKDSVQASNRQADKDKAEQALANPESPESKSISEDYKGLGFEVKPGDSAAALKRRYGDTSDIYQARMKTEQKAPEGISQQYLAGFIKDGGKLVPPGTKGATTFLAVDNLGKPTQIGLIPPPEKKTKEQIDAENGKRLPPDKVLLVNQGNQMPQMLAGLSTTIDDNASVFGPIGGRIGGMNPYNQKAQAIQAQMKMASQEAGKFLEGGVLRKEDESKYEKMFPGLGDTPASAKDKLAIVGNLLAAKQKSNLDALRASGYEVSGLDQGVVVPELPKILAKGNPKSDSTIVETKNAQASGANPSFTAEDLQALSWAHSNPHDKRAADIMNRLKEKGLK